MTSVEPSSRCRTATQPVDLLPPGRHHVAGDERSLVGSRLRDDGREATRGARYELELYPVVTRCTGLEPGVYRYLPDTHGLELVVADSRGDSGRTTEAARRLIQDNQVFALVGSFLPGDHTALDALLAETDTPLIGPLARAPREREAGTVWHLQPSLADQARVLVDQARSAAV